MFEHLLGCRPAVLGMAVLLIELFEAEGWDWAYHAYREWHGWSVEHGTDRSNTSPSKTPTNREKLLKAYFGKNVRPKAASGT